jgi:large subunit ribosomal protein L18
MSRITKQSQKSRRTARTRAKLLGTRARPRASVSVSLSGMFVQLIDDSTGTTLASARDHKLKGTKTERAVTLGTELAEKAAKAGIKKAILDRGPKQYHGRVKAFADAFIKGGIEI